MSDPDAPQAGDRDGSPTGPAETAASGGPALAQAGLPSGPRPEIAVGGAFAGGLLAALLLRRLRS